VKNRGRGSFVKDVDQNFLNSSLGNLINKMYPSIFHSPYFSIYTINKISPLEDKNSKMRVTPKMRGKLKWGGSCTRFQFQIWGIEATDQRH